MVKYSFRESQKIKLYIKEDIKKVELQQTKRVHGTNEKKYVMCIYHAQME